MLEKPRYNYRGFFFSQFILHLFEPKQIRMANTTKRLSWKTEKRLVKDLIGLDYNPRKITEEDKAKLLRSLEKFNLVEIPSINKDNSLITGNQRMNLLMLADRGEEKIDVRVPNRQLTEQEVKEYMLIGNTHAGTFDAKLLEVHFEDIEIEFAIVIPQEPKTETKTRVSGSTMEKHYFLNIRCTDETHCQELFDRLAGEGLEVKIIT